MTPNNETIIEWLEISKEEQKQLLTIKSNEIKKENNNNQRREKRRNENGLTDKQQELLDLRKKAESLRNKGLSNVKIAEKLGTNESKIRRVFKL